jgi:YlqD protein
MHLHKEVFGMKILQTVQVKQVLTEKSRTELLGDYEQKKLQLEKECSQLQFELKKMEKAKAFPPGAVKEHFRKEIALREERVRQLEFQIAQLDMLPLGSELKETEVQAIIEISAGDSWEANQHEIIVRDGIIEEIRKR